MKWNIREDHLASDLIGIKNNKMKMIFKIGWNESFYTSEYRPESTPAGMSSIDHSPSSYSKSWNLDLCDSQSWSEPGISYSNELYEDDLSIYCGDENVMICAGRSSWTNSEQI